MTPLEPLPDGYTGTRHSLHRLAAHVLAPARKAATGRIGLRATPGGFGTPPYGAEEQLRVSGESLIRHQDGHEQSIAITSLAAGAAFAGIELAADPGIGHDPPPLGEPDTQLPVSAAASSALAAWFAFSASVLEAFRSELDAAGRPCSEVQLWPEHFDLGCNIEGANFGASPGDGQLPEPYLYVGPWNTDGFPDGDFWNASFGAVLTYKELLATADQSGVALEFLRHGAALALSRQGDNLMGFLQIIDFHTDDADALQKANDEWRAATEGKRTVRREIVAQDRNDPSHYVIMVFFDSPESAMENSNLPETQASAQQFAALTRDISFTDLDVIDEQ